MRIRRILKALIVGIIIVVTLAGCWSRRELTDLAITVGLGIDKNEKGEFVVTAQIINPSETASGEMGGGGYDTPVTSYTTSGKILFEALRKMTKEAPRRIYHSHLRVVIIGEELAKEDIYDALDLLSRDHELRTDFYILIAKGHLAEDVLNILTNLEKIPANKIFNSLETSADSWAATGKIRLNELMDDIVSDGKQPILTGIRVIGNLKVGRTIKNIQTISPKAYFTFSGLAVFRNKKLVGWLNETESKGLNYIRDNVDATIIVLEMNDGKGGIELFSAKTTIVPKITQGNPSFTVKISGEANLGDTNIELDVMNPDVIAELEEKLNNQIKDVVIKAIAKGQKEYKSDIFGFGERIHKENPKEWTKLKKRWGDIFPNVTVTVKVDMKIRRVGTISDPFQNELIEE